ncbi:uncharacterized protein K460DRAFT_157641 [Cucurbitaria berberidis CBS 394.84]|uniref:1-alkyl-2-acetylglycerophosphocholine esterase n=1 Tax=Cucurbitaria berberidis CBS 394.84 TaxID=1168544 RepID=A0A9P4L7A2_9PLEO|nr:uncharacterized protein K460DRAFT_157641 [Cucurbitaria berberidis CBS 394.84]KAF1844102.1 hypothetical protein K460DRAFT_157641 [Cucurbitaria berberidis CBS 394.84]
MISAMSIALVVLLALFQSSRAILIPPPDTKTHGFEVAVAQFSLTDTAHKDPYMPTEDRKIMLSLFMPVNRTYCSYACQNSYMPPQTAQVADQQFLLNATEGVFEQMEYMSCCGATMDIDASKYPVVILEPHVDTSRFLYANLARYMSANGAVVVLIDHPGDASIVQFPYSRKRSLATVYNRGNVALSNLSPINPWNGTVTQVLDMRTQDIKFALSQLGSVSLLKQQFPFLGFSSPLDTSSYSIVGHGLGGTVATSLSFSDKRVRFSINLSGTPPLLNTSTRAAPIFFFGRANFRRQDDIHWPTTWSHLTGPATEFDLQNSDIFDFSDLPIIVELAHNEGGMKHVQGKGLGGSGPWGNHAVKCFMEGVLKKELLADESALNDCVGMFEGMVPYTGGAH